MSQLSESSRARLGGLMKVGLGIGILGAVVVGLGAAKDKAQFLHSYLYAYFFWLGLSLGSLAFGILHHLTGGRWGVRLKRILESGMSTLPLTALFFLPIALNVREIYPWAVPGAVESDPLLHQKAWWLNETGWLLRAAICFAVWIGCAMLLTSQSRKRDATGDPKADGTARFLAGPMLLAYVMTMTVAAIDWAMTLEPHWFSTMFGVIFVAGQAITTLGFAVLICAWLKKDEQFGQLFSPAHFHDLGTLMFAFSMFWTYTSFSQFLIIWSGNLAEETPWYLHRIGHGWQNLAIALVGLSFFIPFILLMQRKLKQQAHLLVGVALICLVGRHFDLYWQIAPAFHREGFHGPHWLDLVMPFAMGGFWLALFAWFLKGRPITNQQVEMIRAQAHAAHH